MIKELIYKIENKIATRFLKRELDLEYAGKTLILAFDRIIKEAANNKTDSLSLTYEITYSNAKYAIKNDITIEEISNKVKLLNEKK